MTKNMVKAEMKLYDCIFNEDRIREKVYAITWDSIYWKVELP